MRLFRMSRGRDTLALAVLLTCRLIMLAASPGIINGDGYLYIDTAQHIVQTGYLPEATFQARTYAVVIAPIIAMLGYGATAVLPVAGQPSYGHPIGTAVHYFQIVLDLLVVMCLLRWCHRLLGDRGRARWIAYPVVALQPITAAWTNFVFPDALATAALFLGLYKLARYSATSRSADAVVAALLLGVSAAIRIDVAILAAILLIAWLALSIWLEAGNRRRVGIGIAALALFAVPPIMMAIYQYASSGDPRYIRTAQGDNPWMAKPGYFAWTRGWVTSRNDYQRYVLSMAEPRTLDADAYPARAFPSSGDREVLRRALRAWSSSGYDAAVDTTFARFADQLRRSRPLLTYVQAPAIRAASMWVSPEGAAPLTIGREGAAKTVVTIGVVLLKALIALFASIGLVVWLVRLRSEGRVRAAIMTYPHSLICLSAAAFGLRLAEMWALNIVAGGSIIEPRYAIETWPGIIAVAIFGYSVMIGRSLADGSSDQPSS